MKQLCNNTWSVGYVDLLVIIHVVICYTETDHHMNGCAEDGDTKGLPGQFLIMAGTLGKLCTLPTGLL
jgi:hypothetical protein